MLFMAKSALCIGIVSVLAIGAAGSGGVREAIVSGSRETAADLGRACAASSDCLAVGSRITLAAIGQPAGLPERVVQSGIERAADMLAGPQAPSPTAPAADAARPPSRGERHVRRTAASRE